MLDQHTVGVIVEISKEACKVRLLCRRSAVLRCVLLVLLGRGVTNEEVLALPFCYCI